MVAASLRADSADLPAFVEASLSNSWEPSPAIARSSGGRRSSSPTTRWSATCPSRWGIGATRVQSDGAGAVETAPGEGGAGHRLEERAPPARRMDPGAGP